MQQANETYYLLWQREDLHFGPQGTHVYAPEELFLLHYLLQLPSALYYSQGGQHRFLASVCYERK